jgi:hypothetical protein
MMQILGVGGPLLGLGIQLLVWLYIVPLTLALIGLGFMRDCLRSLLFRRDLAAPQRFAVARYQAGQGVMGLAASVLVFLVIYHRKELIQCVTGLF